MTYQDTSENPERRAEQTMERLPADRSYLLDLIEVLKNHRGGLRKWSVMRAMRTRVEKRERELSLKFESDVERVFRKSCAGDPTSGGKSAESALFFRPKDKAGEVWALNTERAEAWLRGDNIAA